MASDSATKRLRRIIANYGDLGLLFVGAYLLFLVPFRSRRAATVVSAIVLLLVAGATVTLSPGRSNRSDIELKRRTLASVVEREDLQAVMESLARGAPANTATEFGDTVLISAVSLHRIDIVQALLAAGADPNGRSNDGFTPLSYAAFGGEPDIAMTLLSRGADINAADAKGWTPLITASQQGWTKVVGLLLRNGADVDVRSNEGKTAIDYALEALTSAPNPSEYREIVRLLRLPAVSWTPRTLAPR